MKVGAGEFIKTNSGEVIWGSEAFIDEVFKTLYGNKFRHRFVVLMMRICRSQIP